MKFSFACVSAFLTPVVVMAKKNEQESISASVGNNNDSNSSSKNIHSSSYSKVKETNVYKKLADRLEVRHQPNKLRNSKPVVDVDVHESKEEAAVTTTTTAGGGGGEEECVPSVVVSKTSKLDAGNLPLSSCSSKKQVCINHNNKNKSASSSLSIEKKTGFCVKAADIPDAYWDVIDPSTAEVPNSYWEDPTSTGNAATPEDDQGQRHLAKCCKNEDRPEVQANGEEFRQVIADCLSDGGTTCPYNGAINCWDVGGVTDMTSAFEKQDTFNEPLGCWDTSRVTTMVNTFYYGEDFNQDISTWDTKKVKDMSNMFRYTYEFNTPLNDWNVKKVKDIGGMFAYSAFNQPLDKWNTKKVEDMSYAFVGSYFNNTVGKWNTKNVEFIDGMFYNADSFNQEVKKWDISKVVDLSEMFSGAVNFNQPVSEWDTSNVENMNSLFYDTAFDQDISLWNTSKVTDMSYSFSFSPFNSDISDWDVSSVQYFAKTFYSNYVFNTNIENWVTSEATDMSYMFGTATLFNNNIENWDVGKVVNMYYQFNDAPNFNQPLDTWNVSSVLNMNYQFNYAYVFNQCLSTWAEKTDDSVLTDYMLNATDCPNDNPTPDPKDGPWCQSDAQGCSVFDECADDADFNWFKNRKKKECADLDESKCDKEVDANKNGNRKVVPRESCPSICNESCISRDVCAQDENKKYRLTAGGRTKCKQISDSERESLCLEEVKNTGEQLQYFCPKRCAAYGCSE